MSNKTIFAVAVVSGAVLASCASTPEPDGREPDTSAGAAVEVGSHAPEFALESAEGTEVSLSGFRGRPVLLYFSMGPG
jgi:cytochrome oxidase Cu insertion factor (SCO1/SenC/PrrC family)